MDDIIPTVDPKKCLKTYPSAIKGIKNATDVQDVTPSSQLPTLSSYDEEELPTAPKEEEDKDLTTKEAVAFLIEGTLKCRVCRYCLKIVHHLSPLEQIINVAGKGAMYKVAIKDIVASFHPFKVADDPNFPDRICEKCLDRAIASYLFTQQCEQAERALKNCFEDMYEKLDKLDPLDKSHKRGRQKRSPNYNTLYAEHEKVINYAEPIIHIVNTASEVLTPQTPINEFECLKCCEILPNLESLINHEKIHPKSMWYNCRLCGSSFPKRHHLKKHFRSKHGQKEPQKPVETTRYQCNRCAVDFDKYYEYLQHIEKHKFKMVMEHVIEKNMDKMCSLCFGKGTRMIGLDETVCLHGGTPELTGERSMYTVLSATLPEKMNKYQELLVPLEANFLRYVKKKKLGTSEFSLSNPTVVSRESFDCHDGYSFIFSEPHIINDEIRNTNDANPTVDDVEFICNPSINKDSAPLSKMEVENASNGANKTLEEKYFFTFSNPDTVNLDTDGRVPKISPTARTLTRTRNIPKMCNEDWIFDNCSIQNNSGANTVDTTSLVNTVSIAGPEVLQCKVCWLFKHLQKCEVCGKSNISLNATEICGIQVEPDSSKIAVKNNIQNTGTHITTKDQKEDLAWHCNICLTTNQKGKEMCICCDTDKPFETENVYPRFLIKKSDMRKDSYDINENNEQREIKESMLSNTVVEKKQPNNEDNMIMEPEKIISIETKIEQELKSQAFIINNHKLINNNTIMPSLEKVLPMDIETTQTETFNIAHTNTIQHYGFINCNEEEMDVQICEIKNTEFSVTDINAQKMDGIDTTNKESNVAGLSANLIQTQNMGNNVYGTGNQFQFNLGWTDKDRKPKRKLLKSRR